MEQPIKKQDKESISLLDNFLWWLSTADATTLQQCPAEKERYRIIGISVLVTWIFATLAWGYFFSTILQDDLEVYGLALFFGFAIMSIDRNLIAAMKKGNNNGWMPFVFRIILAIIIGLFISQPIVLMLFKTDIDSQIVLNNEKKIQVYRTKLASLDSVQLAQNKQQTAAFQNELQQKATEVKNYRDNFIRETDGTGGSGQIGVSSIARVKRDAYEQVDQNYQDLKTRDNEQLDGLQQQADSLAASERTKEGQYASSLSDGFLTRIEALNDLVASHPPVRERYRLIIFIITLIEVMPILSKWLLPKGVYEEKMEQQIASGVHLVQQQGEKERELQDYYQQKAFEENKQSIDQFFNTTASAKEEMANDTLQQKDNGSTSYSGLWKNYKRKIFINEQ